jgi:hypothetical protein
MGQSTKVAIDHAMTSPPERRRFSRVILPRPLPGRFGVARIFVVDLSLDGARIAHQGDIATDEPQKLTFEAEGHLLSFECNVARTYLERPAGPPTNKPVYHSGLRLLRPVGAAAIHLKALITRHVERALDEQKANAKGIPPIAATFQAGVKEPLYLCCRYVRQEWTRTKTKSSEQPVDGFTVSLKEETEQVEMLCQTYQESDFEGRKMIRQIAEMSLRDEAVPTRRYSP